MRKVFVKFAVSVAVLSTLTTLSGCSSKEKQATNVAPAADTQLDITNTGEITSRPWLANLPIKPQNFKAPDTDLPQVQTKCIPVEFEELRESEGPYGDARFIKWVAAYHKCDLKALIKSVEKDLRSDAPHKFAPIIWVTAQRAQGSFSKNWATGLKDDLVTALGTLPDLMYAYDQGTPAEKIATLGTVKLGDSNTDPWALMFIDWINSDIGADEQYDTDITLLKQHPDMFLPWWPNAWTRLSKYNQLQELIGSGGALEAHHGAAMLKPGHLEGSINYIQYADYATKWLERYPNDAYAHRFLGAYYANLERFDDSLLHRKLSMQHFPFRIQGRYIAQTQIRADDKHGAFATANRQSISNGETDPFAVTARYIKALSEAGRVNDARGAFAQIYTGKNDSLFLSRVGYYLENKIDRHQQALEHAKAAWGRKNADWSDAETYIKALESAGQPGKVSAVLEEVETRFGRITPDVAIAGAKALRATDRNDEAENLLQTAARSFPHEINLRDALATHYESQKMPKKQVQYLRDYLADHAGYTSTYNSFFKGAAALGGVKTFEDAYDWALKRNVHGNVVHQAALKQYKTLNENEKYNKLQNKLIAEYPDAFWPVYEKFSNERLNSFAEKKAFIDAIDERYERLSNGDKEWANRNVTSQYRSALTSNQFKGDKEVLLKALSRLKSTQNFGTQSRQFTSQMDLAKAQNDPSALLEAWRQYIKIKPNDTVQTFGMFKESIVNDSTGEFLMAINAGIAQNSYNYSNLSNTLNLHTQWGGSSVYAACLVRWTKENYPEVYPKLKRWETKAMSRHGDHANYFVKNYGSHTGTGGSPRYVEWYQTSKNNALNKEQFVDFDCEQGVVSTVGEDGMIKVIQHDFRVGKMILTANGPAWVRYEYNDAGKLTVSESAGGDKIELFYDEKGQITLMDGFDGEKLSFEYSPSGKPTKIVSEGKGRLDVTYDDDGEMLSVKGFGLNADGNEDEDVPSSDVALSITSQFQKLLKLVKTAENGRGLVSSETDEEFEKGLEGLLYAWDSSPVDQDTEANEKSSRLLRLAGLLKQAADKNYYSEKTMQALDQITGSLIASDLQTAAPQDVEAFFANLYELYSEISPFGLTKARWNYWQEVVVAAEALPNEKSNAKLLSRVRNNPLRPMRNDDWLAFLNLQNSGMWYRDKPAALAPKSVVSGLTHEDVLIRANGDLVTASSAGLVIRQYGIWQRYVFIQNTGSWSRDDAGELSATKVDITSLAETDGGQLLVGTNLGIFVLGDTYQTNRDWLSTPQQGLPASYINDLKIHGDKLYAATSKGIAIFNVTSEGLQSASEFKGPKADIKFIEVISSTDGNTDPVVVAGTDKGVIAVDREGQTQLFNRKAVDAAYSRDDARLLIMTDNDILSSQIGPDGRWQMARPLTNAASARITKRALGFDTIEFDDENYVIAKGDQGFAIWRAGYFEHITLPHADSFIGVMAIAGIGDGTNDLLVAGDEGSVFRYAPSYGYQLTDRTVYDTAFDPSTKLLFVASGNRLSVVDTDIKTNARPRLQPFDYIDAKFLDFDPKGRLIANDGRSVVRYEVGDDTSTLLFTANPYCPSDHTCPSSRLTGMIAAADGSVWASSGPSVYKWKDGEVTEFNAFKDREAFPIDTHWVAGVTELENGQILVSAGNEIHLSYRGRVFRGTNLIFTDGKFVKSPDDSALYTSATNVGDTMILGSTNGFVEYNDGTFEQLVNTNEKSYTYLKDNHPNLFLGGQGVSIGDDVFVFPSAAGIVAYQNGVWFYPERLNWMLPDSHKARLGSRHSYSVSTDEHGRLYVATDAGLTVLFEDGGDALDFLSNNDRPDLAFASAERRKLKEQSRILIDNIDPNSPQGKTLARTMKTKQDVLRLQTQLRNGENAGNMQAIGASSNGALSNTDAAQPDQILANRKQRLRKRLTEKEKEYTQMLAVMEREQPGLHQLLTVKPLELAALRRRIPDNAAVLQFIPQNSKLLLHLVAKDQHIIREVEVDRAALMTSVFRANAFLRSQIKPIEAALGASDNLFDDTATERKELPLDTPAEDLRVLYDLLLAPLEEEMGRYDKIYISTAGPLNYTPFAALKRKRGTQTQYAVERFTFAIVPTSYLLSLVLDDTSLSEDETLIFGDPDGSLSGAKQEAARVAELSKTSRNKANINIGADATIEQLEALGPTATLIHFATHGVLNAEKPERSYLLMADNKRLSMVNIQLMDLTNAELVFLSACETAKGGRGIEYATLARAFAHAGAPTTIASLWPVGDQATLKLVEEFYSAYDADSMQALAQTQRDLLNAAGPLSHPAAWSSFQVYGRGRAD